MPTQDTLDVFVAYVLGIAGESVFGVVGAAIYMKFTFWALH
jgi:hypothetical protein